MWSTDSWNSKSSGWASSETCRAQREVNCGLVLSGGMTRLGDDTAWWWHGHVGLSAWYLRGLCPQAFCVLTMVHRGSWCSGVVLAGRILLESQVYSLNKRGPLSQSACAVSVSCSEGRLVPGKDRHSPGEAGCSAGWASTSSHSAATTLDERSWWEFGPMIFRYACGNIISCHPLLSF